MKRLFRPTRCTNMFAKRILFCSLSILLSACGGPIHISAGPQLTHISIAPNSSTMSLGQTLQLSVSGTYSDGTSTDQTAQVQWSSSNASIAAVTASGLVRASAVGGVSIAASVYGLTASISVTVDIAAPQSIAITPSPVLLTLGQTTQLTVTATLTDGTLKDVTHTVTWNISDPSFITIDVNGLVKALKVGTSNFTASLGGISGAVTSSGTVTVSPELLKSLQILGHNAAMPLGSSQQLTAVGTYNDGAVRDLTPSASWSSSDSPIVSVSTLGEATALALGSATVSAVADGIGTSMKVQVSSPALVSIAVAPLNPRILVGESIQLTAIGTYSDGSTSDITSAVAWAIENADFLQLDAHAIATALSAGSTAVEATLNGLTGNSAVVVRPVALVSYFVSTSSEPDTMVRIVGTAGTDPEICTMIYVFSHDQQMAECCGCVVSREGLRILSLRNDLLSNPLTAVAPDTGTAMVVTAAFKENTACNPAATSPAGSGDAWATHVHSAGKTVSATETPFTQTELGNALLANLQAQCSYIQMLGAGRGVCTCGTGN
jgi:hypothetical protein